MQKGKLITLIIVALLMAVTASLMASKVMSGKLDDNTKGFDQTGKQVVVAISDIAYAQVISADNLMVKQIPEDLIPADAITRIEDATGKVAKGEIFQGELLLTRRLAEGDAGTILAALVGKDMRAVTVRVDDVSGVAGFLLPGNRVDVLGSRMEKSRALTRTVLQDIKVLAVDQTVEASKDQPVLVRAVTLEVSSTDSEALFQAMQEGHIHLTLRNPGDSGKKPELIPKQASVNKTPVKITPVKKKKANKKRKVARQPTPKVSPKPVAVPAVRTQALPVLAKPETVTPTKTVTVIRGVSQQKIIMEDKTGSSF